MAMLLMVSGTAWVFVRVALFAELDPFTTWLPNANVAGVKVVCAYADQPGTRRESKRTVPCKNNLIR